MKLDPRTQLQGLLQNLQAELAPLREARDEWLSQYLEDAKSLAKESADRDRKIKKTKKGKKVYRSPMKTLEVLKSPTKSLRSPSKPKFVPSSLNSDPFVNSGKGDKENILSSRPKSKDIFSFPPPPPSFLNPHGSGNPIDFSFSYYFNSSPNKNSSLVPSSPAKWMDAANTGLSAIREESLTPKKTSPIKDVEVGEKGADVKPTSTPKFILDQSLKRPAFKPSSPPQPFGVLSRPTSPKLQERKTLERSLDNSVKSGMPSSNSHAGLGIQWGSQDDGLERIRNLVQLIQRDNSPGPVLESVMEEDESIRSEKTAATGGNDHLSKIKEDDVQLESNDIPEDELSVADSDSPIQFSKVPQGNINTAGDEEDEEEFDVPLNDNPSRLRGVAHSLNSSASSPNEPTSNLTTLSQNDVTIYSNPSTGTFSHVTPSANHGQNTATTPFNRPSVIGGMGGSPKSAFLSKRSGKMSGMGVSLSGTRPSHWSEAKAKKSLAVTTVTPARPEKAQEVKSNGLSGSQQKDGTSQSQTQTSSEFYIRLQSQLSSHTSEAHQSPLQPNLMEKDLLQKPEVEVEEKLNEQNLADKAGSVLEDKLEQVLVASHKDVEESDPNFQMPTNLTAPQAACSSNPREEPHEEVILVTAPSQNPIVHPLSQFSVAPASIIDDASSPQNHEPPTRALKRKSSNGDLRDGTGHEAKSFKRESGAARPIYREVPSTQSSSQGPEVNKDALFQQSCEHIAAVESKSADTDVKNSMGHETERLKEERGSTHSSVYYEAPSNELTSEVQVVAQPEIYRDVPSTQSSSQPIATQSTVYHDAPSQPISEPTRTLKRKSSNSDLRIGTGYEAKSLKGERGVRESVKLAGLLDTILALKGTSQAFISGASQEREKNEFKDVKENLRVEKKIELSHPKEMPTSQAIEEPKETMATPPIEEPKEMSTTPQKEELTAELKDVSTTPLKTEPAAIQPKDLVTTQLKEKLTSQPTQMSTTPLKEPPSLLKEPPTTQIKGLPTTAKSAKVYGKNAKDEPATAKKIVNIEVEKVVTTAKKPSVNRVIRPPQASLATSIPRPAHQSSQDGPSFLSQSMKAPSSPTKFSKASSQGKMSRTGYTGSASVSVVGPSGLPVASTSKPVPSRLGSTVQPMPKSSQKLAASTLSASKHTPQNSKAQPKQEEKPQPKATLKQEEKPIELPEPDSEYSDSDSEAHHRKMAALPDWAQSPNIRKALLAQGPGGVNPDDIFGPIEPLRMEDLFHTRTSRFKVRSSSANWAGGDGLTKEEAEEYAQKMGYKSK